MTAIHILLQAGNVTGVNMTEVNSAINQFVNQIGVPALQITLIAGGLSFIVSIIMLILHFIEYLWHPTSFGRTSALTEAIFHAKKPIYGALGIFLSIYISLLTIGLESGNPTLVHNAGAYALWLLQAMLRETANALAYMIKQALSATP
jgi:hypothetical protein